MSKNSDKIKIAEQKETILDLVKVIEQEWNHFSGPTKSFVLATKERTKSDA